MQNPAAVPVHGVAETVRPGLILWDLGAGVLVLELPAVELFVDTARGTFVWMTESGAPLLAGAFAQA